MQECARLQHQARDLEAEHKGHLAEVVADVEAMKKAMADQRDELDKAAQRAKRQHDEELSVQKARLATLTGGQAFVIDLHAVNLTHMLPLRLSQQCPVKRPRPIQRHLAVHWVILTCHRKH